LVHYVLNLVVDLHRGLLSPAYIDGGTGSMLLQAALAGFLTVSYLVKNQWANLKARVAARSNRHDGTPGV